MCKAHVSMPQTRTSCGDPDNKIQAKKIGALHHDYLGQLEKSGRLQLFNKQVDQFGVYRADAYIDGSVKLGTTFFPQDWTAQQVIQKITEAYDNFISQNTEMIGQPNDICQFYGITSEGIVIQFFISKEDEMAIAYPQLSCQNIGNVNAP